MSVSHKSRKAKPLNLEDQPQILQFITEGTSDSTSQKTTSKKKGADLQAKNHWPKSEQTCPIILLQT